MKKTLLLALLIFVSQLMIYAQKGPIVGLQKEIPSVYFLKNADVVVSPGKTIKKANIIIRGDVIDAVGKKINCPTDAIEIDMSGKIIYPGFIDMYAQLGFGAKWEEEVKGDDMKHWNFQVNPETVRDLFLYASETEINDYRKVGFTTVQSFADTRLFSGSGSVLLLNDKKITKKSLLKYRYGQFIKTNMHGLPSIKNASSYPTSYQGSISLIRQTMMDAQWYDRVHQTGKELSAFYEKVELNLSLAALAKSLKNKESFFLTSDNQNDVDRIYKLAKEFDLNYFVIGSGYEYRRIKDVQQTGARFILPIKAAYKQNVNNLFDQNEVQLASIKHVVLADKNPSVLLENNIPFVLSAKNFQGVSHFLTNLRKVVEAGLSKEAALESLTIRPAKWLGFEDKMGSIELGKLANLFIADGDIFNKDSKVLETWVSGKRFVYVKANDFGGDWTAILNAEVPQKEFKISFTLSANSLSGTYEFDKDHKGSISKTQFSNDRFSFQLKGRDDKTIMFYGHRIEGEIMGYGMMADGSSFNWNANLVSKAKSKEIKKEKKEKAEKIIPTVTYPEGVYGNKEVLKPNKTVLVKNATIWTASDQGTLENADMLVVDGKVAEIGDNIKAPKSALIVDAQGKHLSPGIIDSHSHISVDGGINEISFSIIPEVRIKDVVDPEDINMYNQLAGGLTTSCLLHGSANPIGGLSAVIKLKWGENAKGLLIQDAPEIMKFALGENVKSPGSSSAKSRYPQSRMGSIEIIKDAFNSALDYRKEWEYYQANKDIIENLAEPRRIIRYEHLLDVIDGNTLIHCHAYRHDEIIAFLRVCEEFGIQVKAFIHTVEGYKVAKELKEHGAGAIVFSDWWGYKMEAYDGIPYNAPILMENGVVTCIHSDNPDHARRLNTEAAKAIYYGNVSEEDALKLATINAAMLLGLEDKIGSLEVGKDADFAIWSASPVSSMTKCEQTWIEGVKYFDINEDKDLRERDQKLKRDLIKDYAVN